MVSPPLPAAPFTAGRLLLRTLRVWARDAHAYLAVALVAGVPLFALELRAGDLPENSPLLVPLLAATWFTGVLVLDKDLEEVAKGDPGLKEFDGEIYYAGRGVDLVDADYVNEIFQAMMEY